MQKTTIFSDRKSKRNKWTCGDLARRLGFTAYDRRHGNHLMEFNVVYIGPFDTCHDMCVLRLSLPSILCQVW